MTVSRGGRLVSVLASLVGLPPAMDSGHVTTSVTVDCSVAGQHVETWTRYFTPQGATASHVFKTTQVCGSLPCLFP